MLNTLVHNMSIHKGSQWAVLDRRVVHVHVLEGEPSILYQEIND